MLTLMPPHNSHNIIQELISVNLRTGQTIHYRKPSDIVKKLLESSTAGEDIQFEWEYNEGCIDKANNADGWLDQVAYFYPYLVQGYPSYCINDVFFLLFFL
jgi:hypothetical protein